jgi:hypothetical protein
MIKTVIINNQLIILDRLSSESDEIFYDRINFILKNYQKADLEKLINYSKIYSNIKYKKCIYSNEIMVQIEQFI